MDLRKYGSTHDNTVLKNDDRLESYSLIIRSGDIVNEQYIKDGELFPLPYSMKSEERFQAKDYLMRTYPRPRSGKLPIDQAVYNYQLRRAKRLIENLFGILVAQ